MTTSIRTAHKICIGGLANEPESCNNKEWLALVNDSGWHVLTDFRNWPNWFPEVTEVTLADNGPPARGSLLHVCCGRVSSVWSIDCWDPPQSIQFSAELAAGEIAYGFSMVVDPKGSQLLISLHMERRLTGLAQLFTPFSRWQQQRHGRSLVSNLAERVYPLKNLQG